MFLPSRKQPDNILDIKAHIKSYLLSQMEDFLSVLELGYYTIRTSAEKIYLPFVSPFTPSTDNLAVANGLEEATCFMTVNCTVGDITAFHIVGSTFNG